MATRWDEGAADRCYPHAQVKFSPDYSSFQADPFYKTRAVAGLKTHVCIEGRPLCQFGGAAPNQTLGKWKAIDNNADIGTAKTLDPASYTQLAAYVFQYLTYLLRVRILIVLSVLCHHTHRVLKLHSTVGYLPTFTLRMNKQYHRRQPKT